MTGEVTLTGRVLPVGGVREKILAARRAGIKIVLLPRHNEKDLVDIPAEVKADLTLAAGRYARRRRAPSLRTIRTRDAKTASPAAPLEKPVPAWAGRSQACQTAARTARGRDPGRRAFEDPERLTAMRRHF